MPAQMISHYQVVRKIGAGGMGEVLLAKDTRLERSVALKVMSAELARNAKQRKRFRSEAKAASRLNHPNICVIHETGETVDGRPFLAMEFIEGQTVEALTRKSRLKIREVIQIGIQVAEALDAAHTLRFVHRDIKPGNIMLDRRGQAKVLDFGLAKTFSSDDAAAATTLTASGVLIGTPHYMSPEQVLGAELDGRSDLFSLGVVLYELVAGQRPFLGKTIGETLDQIVHRQPEPLGLENPIFSPALDEIIARCLQKKPENRYGSAKELAEDLTRLRTAAERATQPASSREPPRAAGEAKPAFERPQRSAKRNSRSRAAAVIVGVTVIAIGIIAWTVLRPSTHSGAAPRPQEKSVAVLPFDNYSEKQTDYLSDGLTEEITATLARVPGLRVASRNSAFTFKSRKEDLRKVGAALGVATLLEGSLRKDGNRVRITAQLIDARNGLHLWADSYDRNVDDIFAVQEDVAAKIASRFELEVAPEMSDAGARPSPNLEAYSRYLKGLHAWNKRTLTDLEEAVNLFKEAIDIDPAYAAPYAGLALTYVVLPDFNGRPNSEYCPLAQAAAQKALSLDSHSAEAHAALGLVNARNHKFKAAEQELQQAVRLNPNYATAHHWHSRNLMRLNKMDEAGKEIRLAALLDPLSPVIQGQVATWMLMCRQYEAALKETERALRTTPHPSLHAIRAMIFVHLDRCADALAEAQIVRATYTNTPQYLALQGVVYGQCGKLAEANAVLAEIQGWRQKGHALLLDVGMVQAVLHQDKLALDAFEQAVADDEEFVEILKYAELDGLRTDPRFQSLVKKLGIPD
jgi:non-specific serine/threonine protein kinase